MFPSFYWTAEATSGEVYLTFDDGPTPGVTDVLLNTLANYHAKATFFCLGRQVHKHPALLQRIVDEGHAIGNHSYSHPDGLSVSKSYYLKDIERGQQAIRNTGNNTRLLRPPYGRINPLAIANLQQQYNIVMWSHLPHDYDKRLRPEEIFNRATQNIYPGSIIVLHDSQQAAHNVVQTLPMILEHLSAKNYKFATLNYLNG